MKRGGGKAGRPMGTWSIEQLENYVTLNERDKDELTLVLAELGHRRMQRSMELKDLVKRLINRNRRAEIAPIGQLFGDFD